ncbi:MAG: MATE family efflux transporter [Bacillota bacterium]
MELTRKSDRLGTEKILPLLFKLSVPSIIGMVIQALYNVVDSIYIGRFSKEALSALSLSFPIQILLIAIAVGTGVGSSSLISRLLGQGADQQADNAAEHTIAITLIYGILFSLIGYFYSEQLFELLTNDPELIALGTEYIRIIMLGSIAMFFPMIANNILRGEGNTFAPMITMLIGAIINIILDPFLIFGLAGFPALGVAGAAYATVIARFISGIFIAVILFSDKNQLKLKMRDFEFDATIIYKIYKVGLPAMVMQLLASIMILGANWILSQYHELAIAAMGIYFRLQSFVFLPVFGLTQGYMPIIGYNYGHNKPQRMKKTIKYGFIVATTFTTLGFVLFQALDQELIRLFNQDPELIKIGSTALRRISISFPIIGPAIVGSTTFQAIGQGLPSLLLSFLRQIILLLPIMYLLGVYYGLSTLWYAFPISETIATILMVVWLFITLKKVFAKMK